MRYDLGALLVGNPYPGRGIVLGVSPDGKWAVTAYFIMGRSVNSRNRVFENTEDGIRTKAFDESAMTDPSLIIYHPVRKVGKDLVVTNGDQTDTIRDFLLEGQTFEAALRTREFEPDGPNWTPRISGLQSSDGSCKLSILKSADISGKYCIRETFEYPPVPGVGRFIHTYQGDGEPLPSFSGEPEEVGIGNDIDAFGNMLWENLNSDNKVSLYVRYTRIDSNGEFESRIYNKNQEEAI